MLIKFLKSFLNIVENPRSLPSFLGIYLLLWLMWHHQFLLSFALATGNVINRIDNAMAAIEEFQHLSVFFVTITLFLFYFSFQVFVNFSRELVDKKERENKLQLGNLDTKNDMEQLVLTLEVLQKQLEVAKDNEKKSKAETNNALAKLMVVQIRLDETAADLEILKNEQHKLAV